MGRGECDPHLLRHFAPHSGIVNHHEMTAIATAAMIDAQETSRRVHGIFGRLRRCQDRLHEFQIREICAEEWSNFAPQIGQALPGSASPHGAGPKICSVDRKRRRFSAAERSKPHLPAHRHAKQSARNDLPLVVNDMLPLVHALLRYKHRPV